MQQLLLLGVPSEAAALYSLLGLSVYDIMTICGIANAINITALQKQILCKRMSYY